jgi:hypothetical protein
MDLIPYMKAGPSTPSAGSNSRTRKPNGARKAIVLISTCCIFALVFFFLGNAHADYLTWRWSSQNGDNGKSASKDGDLYLLGVGKADITGYRLLSWKLKENVS